MTYKDSINLLKYLDINIKEFPKKNKSTMEKEKKIKINQIKENYEENDINESFESDESEEKGDNGRIFIIKNYN